MTKFMRIICVCMVICTMFMLLCTAFAAGFSLPHPEFLEKPTAATPIIGGIISLVCGALCIFLYTRPTLDEYKGRIMTLIVILVLLGILQLLVGLVPEFKQWVFSFLPI